MSSASRVDISGFQDRKPSPAVEQYVLQETLRWGSVQKLRMRPGTKAVVISYVLAMSVDLLGLTWLLSPHNRPGFLMWLMWSLQHIERSPFFDSHECDAVPVQRGGNGMRVLRTDTN